MRLAVAATLSGDTATLERVAGTYGAAMAKGRSAAFFRVLTAAPVRDKDDLPRAFQEIQLTRQLVSNPDETGESLARPVARLVGCPLGCVPWDASLGMRPLGCAAGARPWASDGTFRSVNYMIQDCAQNFDGRRENPAMSRKSKNVDLCQRLCHASGNHRGLRGAGEAGPGHPIAAHRLAVAHRWPRPAVDRPHGWRSSRPAWSTASGASC